MKSARYHAEGVMNIWEVAEMGDRIAKKKHKKAIRRQQRTIEKRIADREIREYMSD